MRVAPGEPAVGGPGHQHRVGIEVAEALGSWSTDKLIR